MGKGSSRRRVLRASALAPAADQTELELPLAAGPSAGESPVRPAYVSPRAEDFASDIPLPPDLTPAMVCEAIAALQADWATADAALRASRGISFREFVSGDEAAASSQIVSRRIVEGLLNDATGYERVTAQKFPDLWHRTTRTPLEVKGNLFGRPIQGHSPEDGWFLAVRFDINAFDIPEVREIRIGWIHAHQMRVDGKKEGSKRTETVTIRVADLEPWYARPGHVPYPGPSHASRAKQPKQAATDLLVI